MTDKPTEAQIKEFWEWCGIDIAKFTDGIPLERIGEGKYMAHPIDLNNLFKYAVPNIPWVDRKVLLHQWLKDWNDKQDDPALALFWQVKEKSNE